MVCNEMVRHTLLPCLFFFFNDTATTEIYTLSLHDALPICMEEAVQRQIRWVRETFGGAGGKRSEEHTSELQSLTNLVCRLLLEKIKSVRRRHQLSRYGVARRRCPSGRNAAGRCRPSQASARRRAPRCALKIFFKSGPDTGHPNFSLRWNC